MADKQNKGFIGKAIDALTNRDEKAAAEAKKAADAKLAAAKAAAQAQAAQANAAKAAADKAAAEKAAQLKAAADKAAAERAAAAAASQAQRMKDEMARSASAVAVAAPKFKAEHKVAAGQTLSDIALKYYGKATKDYWMLIYEANKAVIGSSPSVIKAGQVFKIPELPDALKKK